MAKDNVIDTLPIPAPTMGIVGNVPTTMLNPRACVNCNNVVFKDGIVSPRTGYISYGSGTLAGFPLLLFRYQRWDGEEFDILVTTTNVYYNYKGAWTSIASGLSGGVDTRASLAYIQNYLVHTNGEDAPAKWNGTTWSALTDGAGTNWGTYRPLIFLPFRFRLLGFNDNKTTTGAAIRIMYSKIGEYDDIDGTENSGYIDFTQGVGSRIVGAAPLKNYIGMYKEGCCALLSYIGGSSIFAINVQINGLGLAAKDAIAVVRDSHIFLGSDYNIYRWNGGTVPEPVGNPIKKLLRAEINRAKVGRSFAIFNKEQNQVIFFVPIDSDQFPSRMWIGDFDEEDNITWSKGTMLQKCTGHSVSNSGVERVLLGNRGASDYAGWDTQYEASVEPDADGWFLYGTDLVSVSAGILTMSVLAAESCSYAKWPGVDLAGGFTVKFRAKITSGTGDAFWVDMYDGVNLKRISLILRTNSVYHEGHKICDFDTTDDYHIYRVYSSGTTATLYIDGVNKGSWTMTISYGGDLLAFGCPSSVSAVVILIDYLYFGFGGDEGDGGLDDPATGTTSIYHYDYEALDDDGVTIESEFETGDFVIDKQEHLIKNRRFFGLGLDLKGHSAESKFSIQYSTDEGVEYSTAVKKSLIAAYSLIDYDFLKTTRKIRFKFSDDTLSQKWYLRFYGIKQKERERK